MHNIFSYLYIFFVPLLCISTIAVNAQTKGNELEVVNESQEQLSLFLEKIPSGSEAEFGFENREDFSSAIIQDAYNVLLPNADFYADESIDSLKTYTYYSKYWEIPISVDGNNCCFLIGMFVDDEFKIFTICSKSISSSIKIMNKNKGEGKYKNYILKFPELQKEYFICSDSEANIRSSKGVEICYYQNGNCTNELALREILKNEKKNLKKNKSHEY
ncbi:MAG: hypothetical protein JW798_02835 [Prolixibacteraceae bacterium]|nr:hypothetical protein [Prolixibacteraceae bacterium]